MKNNVRHIAAALRLVSRSSPKGFALKVLYMVVLSLLPLANLFLLKKMVDSVVIGGADAMSMAMPLALGFCGVYFFQRIVGALNGINNDVLSQRLQDYISELLQHQACELDMAYFDTPEYHDTFHRAQQEASYRPVRLIDNLMTIVGAAISLTGVVAIMMVSSWWVIVVMAVLVIPTFVVRTKKVRSIYRFRRENTQAYRRTHYYSAILTQRTFAKEVRVYQLQHYFRELFVESRKVLVGRLLKISRRLGLYEMTGSILEVGALALIIVGLIYQSAQGMMTIGGFVMVFEAFRKGQNYLQSLVEGVSGVYENRLFVSNIFEFLELKPQIAGPQEPLTFPQRVQTIEWRDVTFRYPGMKTDVLSHYSLKAQIGEVTRIQGENGFGKTTLLKLLLRLYDPNEGLVLINGVDIRRFALADLRKNIGTIFQDYVQFACTARENILLGDIHNDPDERRMLEASQMAGADQVIDKLPHGYDTMLGRVFDGGEELSMGQWQRIALARQLYGNAPVMVFDEPTAWLDESARQHLTEIIESIKNDHLIIIIRHI